MPLVGTTLLCLTGQKTQERFEGEAGYFVIMQKNTFVSNQIDESKDKAYKGSKHSYNNICELLVEMQNDTNETNKHLRHISCFLFAVFIFPLFI